MKITTDMKVELKKKLTDPIKAAILATTLKKNTF